MKYIFFDNNERLRSGWRAAIFFVTFTFLSLILIMGTIEGLNMLPIGPSAGSYLPFVIPFGLTSAIAIVFGAFYGKLFEDLPFRALGIAFRGSWFTHFASGCLVGAVALASAVVIAVAPGAMTLAANHESQPGAVATTLISTSIIFLIGALSEETLFRGYLMQTLVRSRHIFIGVLLTSLLFALAHNNNPAVNYLALLNTFLAGIWFAAAYFKTRDLWFPLGIHFMWNWMQGPVFGINVSGIGDFSPDPVLRATDAGPAWLSGGTYGIEGGVACTVALIVSMGLIYFLPLPKPDVEMIKISEPPIDLA